MCKTIVMFDFRGTHTDEEGAWAANDVVWQGHLEKLYDQLMVDLDTMSGRLSWERSDDSHVTSSFRSCDFTSNAERQMGT